MTANSLYSNFIDFADINGNLKNNRDNLDYISALAGGIIKNDIYTQASIGSIYPIIGNHVDTHKVNFINPGVYTLTYEGTPGLAHSELGIKASTSNKYMNTHLSPSVFSEGLNLSFYSNENQQSSTNDCDIGVDGVYFNAYNASNIMKTGFIGFGATNTTKQYTTTKNLGLGFFSANFIDSNNHNAYIQDIVAPNLTNIGSVTSTKPTNSFYISGLNNGGTFTSGACKRYAFVSIISGLNVNKLQQYTNLVIYLQGIKNRQ